MLLLLVSGHQNMLHDIYVPKPKYTSVVFYHLESGTSNWKNYWDGQNTWGNNLTGQAKMELWHLLQKYLQILMLKSGPIFFPLILNSRIQTILILLSVEPETKVSLRCLSWKQSEHLVL